MRARASYTMWLLPHLLTSVVAAAAHVQPGCNWRSSDVVRNVEFLHLQGFRRIKVSTFMSSVLPAPGNFEPQSKPCGTSRRFLCK